MSKPDTRKDHPHVAFIDELGGSRCVADELGIDKISRVSNWRKCGIPWRFRPRLKSLAEQKGVTPPAGFLDDAASLSAEA